MRNTEHRRYHPTSYAAAYLGLSTRYLESLRLLGGGPEFVTFGKAVRYTVDALETWAQSRKRKSTSDDVGSTVSTSAAELVPSATRATRETTASLSIK